MLDWTLLQHGKESLALILALLKAQLYFFYDWTKGNGTSETQGVSSTQIFF